MTTSPFLRSHVDLPTVLLGGLWGGVAIALWIRGAALETAAASSLATLAYMTAVALTRAGSRARMLVCYTAVCLMYGASTRLIDALRLPTHETQLLALDRRWFGETPSVLLSRLFSPAMNDLWSGCYLSYHLYLHWAVIEALLRSDRWRTRYGRVVFSTFAIGFAGYFLFPARGPEVAFPELYGPPLQGGVLTRFNEWIVATMASRYDAFPSLHVLVTASLLACDWRWFRTRFWIMALPAAGMMFATLPLRLHYAIDLLASGVLIGPVLLLTSPGESDDAGSIAA